MTLSKSRLLLHRQCPKLFWLRQFRPELAKIDAQAIARMQAGTRLGEIARDLHPGGVLIKGLDPDQTVADTAQALQGRKRPIFEAAFIHKAVLVRADLLLPARGGLRLVEVKSSTQVKPYHIEDAAIQAWVIRQAGLDIKRVELAHVDTNFVYPGGADYAGLLVHEDVSDAVDERAADVPKWLRAARRTLKGGEPDIEPGGQCTEPHPCPFRAYCAPAERGYPVEVLGDKRLAAELRVAGYADLRKVPGHLLTKPRDVRIWRATKSRRAWFDPDAGKLLAGLAYPRYYLDFESIQFSVPIWRGTRPYQQVPFQWSCHIEDKSGRPRHRHFLSAHADDPRRDFAESLVRCLRKKGPVFVYNRAFEATRLKELSVAFPDLAPDLDTIDARLVDLLPIARAHYYHRDMRGSWSIKAVLPTLAPELAYDDLDVANGGMASLSFAEMIDPATTVDTQRDLRAKLLAYCARDTLAMVKLAHFFQGR